MGAEPGFACRGLSRSFGAREVLAEVDLQVPRGSLVALVGSNGAGKTTLMKILATLLAPTRGTGSVAGHDVVASPEACRRSLGYTPAEERSFHGRLTLWQNLEFFGALQGVAAAELPKRCGPLLDLLDLERHRRTRFAELSSGMKQALALVRSLAHDPPTLLLDEPTRSLSPDLAQRVWALLDDHAHRRGKAILLATHSLFEAEKVADDLAILHLGRLRAQGSPARLSQDHGIPGAPGAEAVFRHFTGEAAP